MNKKILKILGVGLLLINLLGLAFLFWVNHAINTGKLVKWENEWYYADELKEKYPPQEYHVEAKNTPEEVYQNFRQALLDGDKEKALGCIVEEKRESYRQDFNKEELLKEFKKISGVTEIEKSEDDSYDNRTYYYYYLEGENKENNIPHSITFIKTEGGYWKIESI